MKKIGLMLGVLLVVLVRPAIAQEGLMEGLMEKLRTVRDCAGDVERLCAGVVPGGDRIEACIKAKLTQLSPACAGSLARAVPDDGKSASPQRWNSLRAVRYCEIFLIGGNPITRDLKGAVYNTTFLNDPKDSCSDAMWAKADSETLKKQYDVLAVFKNGPRGWATDWTDTPIGAEKSFDGLKARWITEVTLPPDIDVTKKGSSAYKPTTVARKSQMGFDKGKPIFILDDPDGMPWVMQAYSLVVDPNLTYNDLQTLDKKLKLPPGWKYRVKVLDQDLTIRAVNGHARLVQDDLENSYDACFDTACSFKP